MALRSLGAALILYGRVGTYEKRSASLKQGEPGDEHLWRACAESIASRVVEPWRRSGPLDVFVQSWNPELSAAMDAHWQPVASQHATQNGSLSCAGIKLNYCRRTRWALLGMRLALDMRAGWVVREAARGHAIGDHHTVVMMRHDLFWHSDLPVVRAGSATRLWLPYDCETREAAPAPRPRASRARHAPQPSSNGSFAILEPRSEVLGRRCGAHEERRRRVNATLDWCANSVNIDWFFVADAEVATGFTETSTQFAKYAALIKRGLRFNNLAPHHFWGLYFFHTRRLRATCQLGNVAHTGIDFFLGRMLRQGPLDAPNPAASHRRTWPRRGGRRW